MKLVVALTLLLTSQAFAQKARVLIVDPDIDAQELKEYKVETPAQHYALPLREEREHVLKGINSVKGMDELDRDILFMDLKKLPVKELQKKYPAIPLTDLMKMKAKV